MTSNTTGKVSYEDFRGQWLAEAIQEDMDPLHKGRLFATKLVTQWLGITADDDDFIVCDGAGDGGIDIAYLKRADIDTEKQDNNSEEGDTWYLMQSKYGTAFTGTNQISEEGSKVINTLLGKNQRLSQDAQRLLERLDLFRNQACEVDRIVLVLATIDPVSEEDREALNNVKIIARKRVTQNFDVEEVSLRTIWEQLDDAEPTRLSVPVKGQFVEQSSGLLVGTVSLLDLFDFMQSYRKQTGDLNQLYERNVRQFLGGRRKINKGIAKTLNDNPEKFGLYNNGITIVVSGYSQSPDNRIVTMHDPYVVNGCQTTKTIWQVLDVKLNAGGNGSDSAVSAWQERVRRGGVVIKIVRSDEAEITNITRFTNSQNSVREQDFIALDRGFQGWARDLDNEYKIFLEIQRGGADARKAYEKQHPGQTKFKDYVNAFDLIKVYGAGWMEEPGKAFGKNAPFLPPNGSVYECMISRPEGEPAFGAQDLYAAYKIKCIADNIVFGRKAEHSSRRQSRFLFYYIIMRMLFNVILLTPKLECPAPSKGDLTKAILKLATADAHEELKILYTAAVTLVDQYLTVGSPHSAYKEKSFRKSQNLNAFLKAENLGSDAHSPLLSQLLAQQNLAFASIPMPIYEGNPTQKDFVAKALIDG